MASTLIVVENDTFRQTLMNLLYSQFPLMNFEEARNGKEALQKISTFHPDLIFMDIKMREESGLELTKKIKECFPGIIIILLTSYDLPEYRQAAKQSGANHIVLKGSTSAYEILALVDTILSELGPTEGG